MPLVFGERTGHAAIERLDGRIEDGSSGVEMVGAKSVRVARQAGAGKGEAARRDHRSQSVRHLMRLQRFIIAVGAGSRDNKPGAPLGVRDRSMNFGARVTRRTAAREARRARREVPVSPGSAAIAGKSRQASRSAMGRSGSTTMPRRSARPNSLAA